MFFILIIWLSFNAFLCVCDGVGMLLWVILMMIIKFFKRECATCMYVCEFGYLIRAALS